MNHIDTMKLALEALESCGAGHISDGGNQWYDEKQVDKAIATLREALAKQPAQPQQEPVAVPTTSYEHRKFVLVGREWYERFAAFHDDCQIGEQLTWQEKTIRQQGYENGWNDAQRYLKEPQATSPTSAQRKPLTDELWGLLDAVERELNRRAIPEVWLLVAHKAGRAYIEARGIKENT